MRPEAVDGGRKFVTYTAPLPRGPVPPERDPSLYLSIPEAGIKPQLFNHTTRVNLDGKSFPVSKVRADRLCSPFGSAWWCNYP